MLVPSCDQALVEDAVSDLSRLTGGAHPLDDGVEVGGIAHNVRTEQGHRGRAAGGELEHRPVPQDCLALAASEHEPGRAEWSRPGGLDTPAITRAQVAAKEEPALEAEKEVLADGLDALEAAPVEALGEPEDRGARVRRLDGDGLPLEHPQPLGGAMEGVALRHGVRPGEGRRGSRLRRGAAWPRSPRPAGCRSARPPVA